MSGFRFKTKEEFIKEGLWVSSFNPHNKDQGYPAGWNSDGGMNKFLGENIPEKYHTFCKNRKYFDIDYWTFMPTDYIEKLANDTEADIIINIQKEITINL